jgi:hypothetical protein
VSKPRTPAPAPRPAKEPDRKDDKKKAAPAAAAKDPGSAGVAGIVTIVVISAASTFALMSALKSGSDHVERVEPPAAKIEPAASATVAQAPSAAEAMSAVPPMVGAEPALSPTEMDMPPGLALPEDRGLLEFDVGGDSPLYVDGVFVGTGPARVVPLRPGPHEVRVEANGKMIVGLVQIKTGRRTHLALASAR